MRGDTAVVNALRRDAALSVREDAVPPERMERLVARCLDGARDEAWVQRPYGFWPSVLRSQWRLFPAALRLAALGILALGVPVSLWAHGVAATGLDLVAPALAAGGVLVAFGGARRASLEVELACAVRPYELLLARLLLVVGCDLIVALAATGVLLLDGAQGTALHVVLAWLAPLLLLAGLNLALSLRWGAIAAAVPSGGLWILAVVGTTATGVPAPWHLAALAPAHMSTDALLGVAMLGCMLLIWAVASGAAWVGGWGDAA